MFGNIYENKNYRLMAIVPIALLLISLYFIPHIPLDSTLRGGIELQIQTNQTIDIGTLTNQINSKISGAETSISSSSGGVTITIAANQSLAVAQTDLLNIFQLDSNYSSTTARIAGEQDELKTQNNATVQAELTSDLKNQSTSLARMNTQLTSMITLLRPLLNGKSYNYNASSASGMLTTAQDVYANASANYKSFVVSTIQGMVPFTSYTYQSVTPTLGSFFLSQMFDIIIASFIIVALAVFFIFRTPIPALSVVFGAGNDILVALGMMGLFGIPLGVASVGGLLMLIGYSIDTDMLSAIRIIKRTEGTPAQRAFSTMKTGLTMTFAAIITFSVLLIVSYLTFIPTYFEIASVVLFGLIADIFTTWFGNSTMVLWYKQRKDAKSV